jgi:hypothetical protein
MSPELFTCQHNVLNKVRLCSLKKPDRCKYLSEIDGTD